MTTDQPSEDSTEVDYLSDEPGRPARGRRWGLVAVGSVTAAALLGAGAWGVVSFLSSGSSPATAVPSSALGYFALDLDPGAGQQVEAYQTLKKFPALKEELSLDSSDLRKSFFDAIEESSGCEGLDFGADIEPWLGSSAAVAVLKGAEAPLTFGVVEVTDADRAATGIEKIGACADSDADETFAYDVTGDFIVLAETEENVEQVLAELADGTLADDPTYQARVDAAGGEGFLTGYAAPGAIDLLGDTMNAMRPTEMFTSSASSAYSSTVEGLPSDLPSDFASDFPTDPDSDFLTEVPDEGGYQTQEAPQPSEQPSIDENELMDEVFGDFDGAAMSLRFNDGAVELKSTVVGLTGASVMSDGGASGIEDLPSSSVFAMGLPIGADAVQNYLDTIADLTGEDVTGDIEGFEDETGMSVPEDIQALLGKGVSVALDSSADFGSIFTSPSMDAIPVGVRINGDPATIVPALKKALVAAGIPASEVVIEEGDAAVAVGFSADYAKTLAAGDGGLGKQDAFTSVLPDLSDEQGAFFLDLDGDWLGDALSSMPGEDEQEIRENVEPLKALGATSTADGETSTFTLRLTTD